MSGSISNPVSNSALTLTSPLTSPASGPMTVAGIAAAGAAKVDGNGGAALGLTLYGVQLFGGVDNAGQPYTVSTLPALPPQALPGASIPWVSNGRKPTEGAGAGSGVPVMWGPATPGGPNVWLSTASWTQVQA